MVDVNTGKIQEIKKILSNSFAYFNKNEFIKIMKEFNEDEIISFFDDDMVKYLEKIDSYDILFVKDSNGKPYVGWIDKDGNKVIVQEEDEVVFINGESLPETGEVGKIYVFGEEVATVEEPAQEVEAPATETVAENVE